MHHAPTPDPDTRTPDASTAAAFAHSWNDLPEGAIYTQAQVDDWLAPLPDTAIHGSNFLELGCGGGHLLLHVLRKNPKWVTGVDLGDALLSAKRNLDAAGFTNYSLTKGDLCAYEHPDSLFDIVICIGVLHHLSNPAAGFDAVLRNTKPGGRFHAWVYGHEGNAVVRWVVEPLRRITSRLPWRFVKYGVAMPLAFGYFLYANILTRLPKGLGDRLPMAAYTRWIAQREFLFFHHVAFDQLVTPQTVYMRKQDVEALLEDPRVDPQSIYIIQRNGNSWKFGGVRR